MCVLSCRYDDYFVIEMEPGPSLPDLILPALQKKTLADMFRSQEMEAQKESEITGHSVHSLTRAVILALSCGYLISQGTGKGKWETKRPPPSMHAFSIPVCN